MPACLLAPRHRAICTRNCGLTYASQLRGKLGGTGAAAQPIASGAWDGSTATTRKCSRLVCAGGRAATLGPALALRGSRRAEAIILQLERTHERSRWVPGAFLPSALRPRASAAQEPGPVRPRRFIVHCGRDAGRGRGARAAAGPVRAPFPPRGARRHARMRCLPGRPTPRMPQDPDVRKSIVPSVLCLASDGLSNVKRTQTLTRGEPCGRRRNRRADVGTQPLSFCGRSTPRRLMRSRAASLAATCP